MGIQFSNLRDESLSKAVMTNQLEVIEQYMSRGVDLNKCDDEGNYALYTAIRLNKIPVVELLLKKGADPTLCDAEGISFLQHAFLLGRFNVVNLLLENGADKNAPKESVTFESCKNLTDFLMNRASDFNIAKTNFPTVLQFAMLHDIDMAVKLVYCKDFSFDPNARNPVGDTLLKKTVDSKSLKTVRKLIRLGADVDAPNPGGSILYHAVFQQNLNMVRLLLDHRACPNYVVHGKIPLIAAIFLCQEEIVQLLLERGANANTKDCKGNTTLDWICFIMRIKRAEEKKCAKIMSLLFKYGIDGNQLDSTGKTVLHRVCINRDLRGVRLLLQGGNDIHEYCHRNKNCNFWKRQFRGVSNIIHLELSKSKSVEDAFHYTMEMESFFFHLRKLFSYIENGIDVNIRDENNRTALHYAAENMSGVLISHLLKKQANVNFIDDSGLSALQTILLFYNKNPLLVRAEAKKRIAEIIAINETNGQDVCKQDLESVNSDLLRDYYAKCKEEIRKLKKTKISEESTIRFYDFLSKDITKLGKLANNISVMLKLKSDEYKNQFPIYEYLLERKFQLAELRKILIQVNELTFQHLITMQRLPKLPINCIIEILEYTRNIDLLNFASAVTPKGYVRAVILKKLIYFTFSEVNNNLLG